jgi:phosphoglycerate dehydrogenase-like enzyme
MASDHTFHLHLETRRTRPEHLKLTEAFWGAAAKRHSELAKRLRVTIGWDDEILEDALKTADFMITQFPPQDRLAERAPRLKWIQTTGAGIDQLVPLDWLPPHITLTNNRGAHGAKAEDSCTLAILALHMRFAEMLQNQRDRAWKMILTPPVAGKTAVVVGFGDLGQGAGRAAQKLGLRVLAVTRSGKAEAPAEKGYPVAQIDDALPLADFLILTAPATPATQGLLDKKRLDLLKPECGIINIGRAALMDYPALREKLERGELAGAVLDVFDDEPLPPNSPWWTTRSVIVTPHISCDSPAYIDALLDRWFENFGRFLAGKPLQNAIDPKRGY